VQFTEHAVSPQRAIPIEILPVTEPAKGKGVKVLCADGKAGRHRYEATASTPIPNLIGRRPEAALWFHSRGFAADDDLTRMRLYEGACAPRCSISSFRPIALQCVLLHRGTRRGCWSCVRA